jgi:hypothetical protein
MEELTAAQERKRIHITWIPLNIRTILYVDVPTTGILHCHENTVTKEGLIN